MIPALNAAIRVSLRFWRGTLVGGNRGGLLGCSIASSCIFELEAAGKPLEPIFELEPFVRVLCFIFSTVGFHGYLYTPLIVFY